MQSNQNKRMLTDCHCIKASLYQQLVGSRTSKSSGRLSDAAVVSLKLEWWPEYAQSDAKATTNY